MTDDSLEKISQHLKSNEEIVFAYLYGSIARGEERQESDIDIAIYVKDPSLIQDPHFETKLALELEKLTKRSVDVRVINSGSLLFIHQVLRDGKLLLSKDERRRIDFEVRKMDEYFDFRPLIEKYDKKRLERYGIG